MRCSTHCPDGDLAAVAAVVIVAVAAVVAYAELAAITDALELLLAVSAVACAAGTVALVRVLRRSRGAVTTAAQLPAPARASQRALPVKRQAAISAPRPDALIGYVIDDSEVQRQEVRR